MEHFWDLLFQLMKDGNKTLYISVPNPMQQYVVAQYRSPTIILFHVVSSTAQSQYFPSIPLHA
jgi:hypothetical protein